MKRFTAITHISLCLVSMTATVILLAIGIGLIPSPYKIQLRHRAKLCENLAIQLCSTPQAQLSTVFRTIAPALVARNPEIKSVGFREPEGALSSQTENHSAYWRNQSSERKITHVELPIWQEDQKAGTIEICFEPFYSQRLYGLAQSAYLPLIAFVTVSLFVIFRLYLKRVLRHLDPSSVIPGRVKTVLDNLSESVVVVDNDEQIVFANKAFAEITQRSESELIGRKLSLLPWVQNQQLQAAALPWLKTLSEGTANTNVPVMLKHHSGKNRHSLVNAAPIIGSDGKNRGIMTSFTDVTEIEQKNKELIELSRSAGMAEVATNVLHNVGNILNSVNVSTSVIARKLSESKLAKLHEVAKMMMDHSGDLGTFFTTDSRAAHIPSYLSKTTEMLLREKDEILQKVETLQSNIEHLKETIRMQQSYAVVQEYRTVTSLQELIQDALELNQDLLKNSTIAVVQEFDELDLVSIDKPLVLQILVNLIRNAVDAVCAVSPEAGQIVISCLKTQTGQARITVKDNGIGIRAENMTKIFRHGFTTKPNGHGFGLHSSSVNAKKMGGSLTALSEGERKGAAFTLELPLDRTDLPKGDILCHATDAS